MAKKTGTTRKIAKLDESYGDVLSSMVELLEAARRLSSRAVNSVMTATYWEMGRRIVELDQAGEGRAEYGEQLIKKLAVDLSKRFGRGFAWPNLYRMRRFYAAYPKILSTPLTKLSSAQIDKKLSTALTESQSIEHWTRDGENPPVGLILCARNDESVARYALDNLPNKVMAREYKLALPDEQLLIDELQRTQRILANRKLATDN